MLMRLGKHLEVGLNTQHIHQRDEQFVGTCYFPKRGGGAGVVSTGLLQISRFLCRNRKVHQGRSSSFQISGFSAKRVSLDDVPPCPSAIPEVARKSAAHRN